MSNLALDLLIKKRQQLQEEKESILQKYNEQVLELNHAIMAINGGKLPNIQIKDSYDDDSPTYITGTEDGI